MRDSAERLVAYVVFGGLVILSVEFVIWVGGAILHHLDHFATHFLGGILR
jgi:hypothetical protein